MGWFIFLGIIITIVVIALFIWLITIIYQEGPKPQDFTIIDNFMPQHTNGFSQGILLDIDVGSKRDGYSFVPKDIDYYGRRKRKNMTSVEPQLIYIDKRKVISFPRGTFSGERNRIWLLPPEAEDLPEEMKTTKLGKVIMTMIDEINNNQTEVDMIREGASRVREIYQRIGDGEISSEELDRLDQAHTNIIKQTSRVDDKKSSGSGSPPNLGQ